MGVLRLLLVLGVAVTPLLAQNEIPPTPPAAAKPEATPPANAQPETPSPTPSPPPAPAAAPQNQPAEPPPAQADEEREVVVTMRTGERYSGVLVSRDEKAIVIKIAGIDTTLKASQVERVQEMPSVHARYEQMKAAIDPSDAEGIFRLAQWLQTKGQWDDALTEINRVLALQPDHPQALEARTIVEGQRVLARKAGLGKRPPPPQAPKALPQENFPLLSDREVNLIKVYEVDLTDPPRMLIDRETIKALISEHENDPLMPNAPEARDALYGASPARLLDMMFRMQARNLYEKVKVVDQPRSMKLFRDRVHRTWLVNACATTRCHGGNEAGRLMLASERPGVDSTVYTNFLILDRFKTRDGKPLINYEEPAKSVLLQVAMARERSTYKHPEVPGMQGNSDLYRPVFKSEEDARFQDAIAWIKAMYRPRPVYPVDYTPPGPQGVPAPDPKEPAVVR